jgi:hypothetical protein
MLLQGSVQRFNLPGILQFLAQNSATGVLEVRDFEEYGFVYIVNGRVEGVSLPITDQKLGTRLVKAGCLTESQLAEALMEDSALTPDEKRLRPLGERLVEKGFTNEAKIREVMNRQISDQVFELASWRNGVFIYDEPEQMPQFQVTIESDVQELILEAMRRVDEGERSRKGKNAVDNEVCFACPLEYQCTPVIKAKHLKNDVCLWRSMTAVMDDSRDGSRDSRELYCSPDEDRSSGLEASLDWQ